MKVRRVVLSDWAALMLSSKGRNLLVAVQAGLPKGAAVLGQLSRTETHTIEFLVEHFEFEDVRIGAVPPEHPMVIA